MNRTVRAVAVLLALVTTGALGLELLHPDATDAPASGDIRELVVLVHGMGRSPLSMLALEHDLEGAGYRVMNWGYSSTCCSIAELGTRLQSDLERGRGDAPRVHFVGHSLGNLVIRWALTRQTPPKSVGRVVMLAPPNQGSHTADRYSRWFGNVLAPLPELTTDPASTARTLPVPAGVAIGVIAGAADGKVTVAETQLDGARQITVPGTHTFLMLQPAVLGLVRSFLKDGTFPVTGAGGE